MLKPGPRTALVTHKNCLDGSGCAAVFIKAGGDAKNVFFRDPRKCALSPAEAAHFDEVWFADLCPPELDDPAGGKPWRVFDHHDTNVRRHRGHPNCTFSDTMCGTALLADALGEFDLAEIIHAIQMYDFGDFNDISKHLADLAAVYDQADFVSVLMAEGNNLMIHDEWHDFSDGIGAARASGTDKISRSSTGFDLDGLWVALAVAPRQWGNDVAIKLLDGRQIDGKVPDAAAVIDIHSNSVSLRCREGGPNMARLAERFGGGGHPRAAGIGLRGKVFLRLIAEEIFG